MLVEDISSSAGDMGPLYCLVCTRLPSLYSLFCKGSVQSHHDQQMQQGYVYNTG